MKKNVLYVQMFDRFELEWDGKKIISGTKSRESQFSLLIQIILHYRKSGVSRDELKQAVFEERELENDNHALRSIIYNARKKLRAAGLPDVAYIEQREGRYY